MPAGWMAKHFSDTLLALPGGFFFAGTAPCPIDSLGIAVCTGYRRKNKLLLVLLVLWGLTGIKSVFFHVYEDLILFACGIYGIAVLAQECRLSGKKKNRS